MKPIHKVKGGDELRPTFDYLQVKDGQVCSLNAFQLVVLPAEEVFGKDVIKTDDELYFDKNLWQKSGMGKAFQITREGFLFNAIGKNYKTVGQMTAMDKATFEEKIAKFPTWSCAVPAPSSPLVDTPHIGINPTKLFDLCSSFGNVSQEEFRFFFRGDKAVIVKHQGSSGFGLIMPTVQYDGEQRHNFNYPTKKQTEENDLL